VRVDALGSAVEPNARISALMTPLLSAANVKAPSRDMLPLNARVEVTGLTGDFRAVGNRGFVASTHLDKTLSDWVEAAERFVGVPYLWGGKTFAGLDCSGLIQTARHAAGLSCPRDTDMQMAALGESVPGDVKRGDLVFWKGHVGVMLDAERLLHANAFHNEVAIEPLSVAQKRIETTANLAIASIKRVQF
jgi:cell wall-associated NlpC family hydrolase